MESAVPERASAPAPRRILVVRLGAIGDCLRVLPSVARLRAEFPSAEIGWAVGSLCAPLLEGHPLVTRLHVVERPAMKSGVWSAWRELKRVGLELAGLDYDVAIDFHTRLKSGYLVRASGARMRIGFDRSSGTEANFLFTNCRVRLGDIYENRVLRFASLLAPLGIKNGVAGGDRGIWVPPAAMVRARQVFEEAGRPMVAICPSTSPRRIHDRWPSTRWQEVVARLGDAGVRSMVLWGPGELEEARAIVGSTRASRVAPETTLHEMMALAGFFRLYVGANTAAFHMAWMQGVPSVVLVGGRPWRTDRALAPVASVMLSAGDDEPRHKLHGEAARRAIDGIETTDVLRAIYSLPGWSVRDV